MNRLAKSFAAISLAIAAGVPGAQADILAFGSYPNAIFVTDAYEAVPLRKTGAKTLTFTTTEPDTLVAVTYNVSCLVESYSIYGGIGTVRVMIEIDGVEANSSTSSDSFCGVQHPAKAFGSHSRQVAMRLRRPGTHTVQVIAIRDQPAVHAAFYFSSILVQD